MAYTVMQMSEYNELIRSTPADQLGRLNGYSPGGVAGILGITRQAVHNAIKRDRMQAYKLKSHGRVVAIIVPDAEVQRYRREHLR